MSYNPHLQGYDVRGLYPQSQRRAARLIGAASWLPRREAHRRARDMRLSSPSMAPRSSRGAPQGPTSSTTDDGHRNAYFAVARDGTTAASDHRVAQSKEYNGIKMVGRRRSRSRRIGIATSAT
jgi:hypothetical protein